MPKKNTQTAFGQYYRDIKDKVNRKVFRKYAVPWMKSKEFDIVREALEQLNPKTCLEWGSGFSTLYCPTLINGLESWHSIEHHVAWHQFISGKITDSRVSVTCIEPQDKFYDFETEKDPVIKEGTYENFQKYVHYPLELNMSFDFIFIDGRARKYCLKEAYNLLNDHGVVIVHDANRLTYFEDLPPFEDFSHFTDYRLWRKTGGIWVGVKKGHVQKYLNVLHHKKLWRQHDQLAKTLFLR